MKNKKILLSLILVIFIFCFIVLLDLLTKHFIITILIPEVGNSIDVIPGFINFVYVKNTGAAWGLMAGRPIFLIIISIIVLGIYIWFYVLRLKKRKTSVVLAISVGLISGGCIGNLFDRIVFGYVRDFINFQFMNFPVFNFADISLTFGIILMIIYFIFIFSKEENFNKNKLNLENNQTKSNNENNDKQINIDLSNSTFINNEDLDNENLKHEEDENISNIQKYLNKNLEKSENNEEKTSHSDDDKGE